MPWGDSFVSGFSAGSDAREKKKRRASDEARDKAERELRLDLQAKQYAAQERLQSLDQIFRGGEGDKDRTFRGGERTGSEAFQGGQADKQRGFQSAEGDKDRTFRTGERTGTQEFQGTQGQLERDARGLALDKELGVRRDTFNWQKDPANPGNKAQEAYAKMTMANLPPDMNTPSAGLAAPVMMNQQQVLEAVKTGKMTREEAAAIAQKQGWR